MSPEALDGPEARARALSLLEATHRFPCEYAVTIIAFNLEAVTAEVKRAVVQDPQNAQDTQDTMPGQEPNAPTVHEIRASREGKYLSHRIAVRVGSAGEVLELYARLKVIEGVVTLL